jgi:23S rRNA (cytidine1920-2'-O)/16S rRNA (cytidine1409-2'-O)-methyltransferase
VDSRTQAQEAIGAGRVLVSGSTATKADRLVATSEPIEVSGPGPRYVSRGGDKLEGAVLAFDVAVAGRRCLDVGSSTGGFTDCLLQHGATHVVALDVGTGQLDWKLRNDARVTVLERTDVRDATQAMIGDVELVTVDVSFISLRSVLPAVASVTPGAEVVALVKPQFEVGRRNVPRGGVVKEHALHVQAVADVTRAAQDLGYTCLASMPSPITGAQGNQEYFLHLAGER